VSCAVEGRAQKLDVTFGFGGGGGGSQVKGVLWESKVSNLSKCQTCQKICLRFTLVAGSAGWRPQTTHL